LHSECNGDRNTDACFCLSDEIITYDYAVYCPAEGAGFVLVGVPGWAVNEEISTLFISGMDLRILIAGLKIAENMSKQLLSGRLCGFCLR
jgi:hypothetical protein